MPAVFIFHNHTGHFSVYKSCDTDPRRAVACIRLACLRAQSQFEPGEYAASFVAASKADSDRIRLSASPEAHGDLEYVYEITCIDHVVHIAVSEVTYRQVSGSHRQGLRAVFSGTLEEAHHWALKCAR